MASQRVRTLLVTAIVILGCGVVGFMLWTSDQYRAATPLVFILGAVILLTPAIRNLRRIFMSPTNRSIALARQSAKQARSSQESLWRSGVPQLIVNLYFKHIQHYPEWIRQSRDYVPSSVTNAGYTEQERWVRILMYFADYLFPFREWGNEGEDKEGILEIVREGERVLSLRIRQWRDKYNVARWKVISIETFVMGDWIRDFQNLKSEIIAIIKDRERDARES